MKFASVKQAVKFGIGAGLPPDKQTSVKTVNYLNIFVNNRDQGFATFLTLNTTCMRNWIDGLDTDLRILLIQRIADLSNILARIVDLACNVVRILDCDFIVELLLD